MPTIIINLLINIFAPLGIKAIEKYINSTETKKDDLLLDLTKKSVHYLANNSNNTITKELSNAINETKIITQFQKSKNI